MLKFDFTHPFQPKYRALIIAGPGTTHFMLPPCYNWGWFNFPYWIDNYPLPIFSVNENTGSSLRQNPDITVTGFIDQNVRVQTKNTPGVISHNVVAYRNISNSPNNGIVVLSNRIDNWWNQGPGDSGVGGAILLGIAKYFKDNNIIPKYNLTYLFTTGEEYGMRGAQHFIDTHPKGTGFGEYNYITWIGFDQLGFNLTAPGNKLSTQIRTNVDMKPIIGAISNDTNYQERTDNFYDFNVLERHGGGTEDYVWKNNAGTTIQFGKENGWDGWHRAGNNYHDGDSLANIDFNDVNVTSELAWNVTKYFCVNPNCHFDDISYSTYDSHGDQKKNSIQAIFTVKSCLPSDKVMVNATLVNSQSQPIANKEVSFVTNRSGSQSQVNFTMSSSIPSGLYHIIFHLYNSTGRINKTLNLVDQRYNESQTSPTFYLHNWTSIGSESQGTTSESDTDCITGTYYTINQNGYGTNVTAYVTGSPNNPRPTYRCMIYRQNDSKLIGTSNQLMPTTTGWHIFTFNPNQRPPLHNGTNYVITIWGDNTTNINYTTTGQTLHGKTQFIAYGPTPPDPASFTFTCSRAIALFCSYVPDDVPPVITNIAATPSPIGFGRTVNITADITDELSGVDHATTSVYTPGGISYGTMTHTTGNHYKLAFTDTWKVGRYNYTITAFDVQNNQVASATHSFNVSATAKLSVATTQDTYTNNQYINLTDPPNPPQNYTLVNSGPTWNTYYNATTGNNILDTYPNQVNYQPTTNSSWQPINTTLTQLPQDSFAYSIGYRTWNNQGPFAAYFKPNTQDSWPVAFAYNRSTDPTITVVRSKLASVGYIDPTTWTTHTLQTIQNSPATATGNTITYPSAFTGTDITYTYQNTQLKEAIILSNTTKTALLSHPPSQFGLSPSSYLVFATKLDSQSLTPYDGANPITGNTSITAYSVDYKDALGHLACSLPIGIAYEQTNTSTTFNLTYRIVHQGGDTYLLSCIPYTTLTTMTFPVIIDPTYTLPSKTSDGYLYNSNAVYNTAWTAATGTISNTATTINIGQDKQVGPTNYVYRGMLLFNTSSLPKNGNISTATLGLYKYSDNSTTDFNITIQNGQPTYPHDPLQTGDYNKSHYAGNGGGLNTTGFKTGWNNITLSNTSWIKNTETKLCLRSSRDISGTPPTTHEFVKIYSGDASQQYIPKLTIVYRNQSKLKNNGSTGMSGYLLIQVQYHGNGWVVDNDTINETTPRTITVGHQLGLDIVFNGLIKRNNLKHGNGIYRIYAAFRDPNGNILVGSDQIRLVSTWQFTVSGL